MRRLSALFLGAAAISACTPNNPSAPSTEASPPAVASPAFTPITATLAVSTDPTLNSITPSTVTVDTHVSVDLSGTRFAVGATAIAIAGDGLIVTGVAARSSTSIQAQFASEPLW